jgi:hypothetical protein
MNKNNLSSEGHLSREAHFIARRAFIRPRSGFIARSAFILLLWLGGGSMLFAQGGNGVKVSDLAVNVGSATTVTFTVSWQTPMPVDMWSDTVWVFVDYNNNGVMERLPVSGATATAGTVTRVTNNTKGVWIAGNARTNGTFSATVRLFSTLTGVAGVCAYASNYPPVQRFVSDTRLSFTGTPPYDLVLKPTSGSTITRSTGADYDVPASYTVQSFTDRTGAPGKVLCGGAYPLPTINTQPQSLLFCSESTALSLTVEATSNWGGALTYRWMTGDNVKVGTDSPAYTATVTASADYWVEVADVNDCSATSDKAEMKMSVKGGTIGSEGGGAAFCGTHGPGMIGV